MNQDATAKQQVPTLSLDSAAFDKQALEKTVEELEKATQETVKDAPIAPEAEQAIARQFTSSLSEEELKVVHEFSEKIDLGNANHVMMYGADAQKKVSDFADSILNSVKTKDAGDVGDMLADLVGELRHFEDSAEKPKGIRSWFSNPAKQLDQLRAKFDDVSGNVEKIAEALEKHQVQLLKDVSMLDHLYDTNLQYFKELTMYIVAGEERLKTVRETTLKELKEKAAQTEDAMEARHAADLAASLDRFEKKLHDLKLTRQISLQMAPQIRLLQNNDSLLVERIQSTLVNTLPLWKNQMVLALGLQHTQEAVKAQRAVTDMTNELLKKNAEKLKMGTIETAKESERSIIDIQTLVETNQSLIDTMNEVVRIQAEGRQQRIEAEKTLYKIENELKNRLVNG
ncbi:MAG TPA: toxic anion resistance protein [Clostridiales bacterium]|jgi:uncharacterized protein YaaN involved in tellurite resistance|nr:toxic anion resistance protein [Clostridiales bacterium]